MSPGTVIGIVFAVAAGVAGCVTLSGCTGDGTMDNETSSAASRSAAAGTAGAARTEQMRSSPVTTATRLTPTAATLRLPCLYADGVSGQQMLQRAFWLRATEAVIDKMPQDGATSGPVSWVRMRWTDTHLLFYVEVQQYHAAEAGNVAERVWNGNNIEFLICPRWFAEGFYDEYEFLFNSDGHDTTLHWRQGIDLDRALAWPADGMQWQVTQPLFHTDQAAWALVGSIPLASMNATMPHVGDYWGLGLFRKDLDGDGGVTLLAWSPPFTDPPKFHTPERFGALTFIKEK